MLRGLADSNRALEYLDALIEYMEEVEIDRGTALELANYLSNLPGG